VEREVSPNTVAAYGSDLARFARDLAGPTRRSLSATKVTEADILAHIARLTEARLSLGSQTRHLAAIRSFFRFLRNEKIIDLDPTELVELPRRSRTIPEYLTVEEVDRLFAGRHA
jgi:integrase/recombinase XerD